MKKISFWTLLVWISCPVWATEYVSLKYNEVNMRTGPGERFPIKWVYQEKNYPVEVLDSFETWRYVRDKDGDIGWIHQNQLNKARSVLIMKEAPLLKKTDETRAVAVLQPGVIARLNRCPKGDYCRLSVQSGDEKYTGWFLRSNLWGVDAGKIIDKK